MKVKKLAVLLFAGLLMNSVTFAANGMDGSDDGLPGAQTLAMDDTTNNANAVMQNPGGSDPASGGAMGSMNNSSPSAMNNSSGNSNISTSNTNDDMSADTATGDDDY